MNTIKRFAFIIAFISVSYQLSAQSVSVLYGSPCVNTNMVFQLVGSTCSSYNWSIQNATLNVHYQVIGSSTSSSYQVKWLAAINGVYANCSYMCASGSSSRQSSTYNVTGSITPAVSMSLNTSNVCQGPSSINFTATPTNGGTPSYSWYVDGVFVTSTSAATYTHSTSSLSAGSHTAYVIMSSNAPCITVASATSTTQNFTVTAKTTYTVNNSGPSQICSSNPVGTFYATAPGSLGTLSYQWYKNGSAISGATSNPMVNQPVAAGNTIYCIVSSNYWCINTPVQSDTYTVAITNSSTPSVGIYVPKLNYCTGETINFTSSQTAATYSWKLGGTQFSTASSASLPVSTDVNAPNTFSPGDVVTLDVTGLSGTCLTTTSASATTSGTPFVINPMVTPAVYLSPISDICLPGGVTLTANPTNAGSTPTYTFFLDNVQVASGSSISYVTGNLSAGPHSAYVRLTSTAPCTTSTIATSVTLNFNGVSKVSYTVNNSGPAQICSSNPVGTFYATAPGSLGTLSYQWYKNGSAISGATSNPMVNQPVAAGNTIYCIVSSNYWCTIPPVQSNTYNVVITPSTTPSVSILVSPLTYCSGTSITFSSSQTAATYSWRLGGTQFSTANSTSLPVSTDVNAPNTFSPGDVVTLDVTGLSGTCLTTTSASASNPAIIITPLPIAPITSTLLVHYNAPAVLTASGAIAGETYKWYDANDGYLGQGTTYTTLNSLTQNATYKVSKFSTCEGPRVAFSVVVNQPPSADAGLDQSISLRNSYTLWGNGADTDGTVATYTWTKTSGGAITMTPNYNTLALSNILAGTYVFRLTATDDFGDSAFDEVTVIASPVSNNYNYVKQEVVNIPLQTTNAQVAALDIPNKNTAISYSDGVGKGWEAISLKSSPTAKDMLQVTQYDELNRPKKSFLPIPLTQATGAFKPGVLSYDVNDPNSQVKYTNSLHQQTFQNFSDNIADDTAPYVDATYELSPLGRVLKQGSVGATYQPDQHYSTMAYSANAASDIRIYTISGNLPVSSNTYTANLLSVTIATDEESVESQVITNREGLKLVTRTKVDATNWSETYYVYDTRNQLRFMLPPELMRLLKVAGNYNPSLAQINTWAYQYIYDEMGRVVETRGPGNDPQDTWSYTVYDSRDRVVLTQDAKQRLANEWSYTKYDDLNRPVVSGIYQPGALISRTAMQLTVDGLSGNLGYQNVTDVISTNPDAPVDLTVAAYAGVNQYKATNSVRLLPGFTFTAGTTGTSFSVIIGSMAGSSAEVFPATNDVPLVVSYYDSYQTCDICKDINFQFTPETWVGASNEPFQKFDRVKGHAVGGSVKVLGPTNQWLHTVSYYNKNQQMIQTISSDHLNGRERSSSLVDFSGKTLESLITYIGLPTVSKVRRRFDYDHAGRVLKAYHQINSQPEVVLANNVYNELGQLVDKSIHSVNGSAYLQSVDYRYTIQGRLARMNSTTATDPGDPDDYFGFEVAYENTFTSGAGSLNTARYDGAITGLKWRNTLPQLPVLSTSKVKENGFAYGYNNLGWLTSASYKENTYNDPLSIWNRGIGRYDEKGLTYDYNGNILALDRYTKSFSSVTGLYFAEKIDQLGYNYGTGGNQLMKVDENSIADNKKLGFKNGNNTDNDYAYDINGNLIQDKNKKINLITYNFQNLTDRITFNNNSYIQYTYDAGGSKLREWYYDSLSQPKIKTDYVGELIIVNDQLKFADHEEGRLVMPDNSNLVANTIRDANSLEGFGINPINVDPTPPAVVLSMLNTGGQAYIKAICNQTTSTPGIYPIGGTAGVYNVKQGESYSFMVLGYQSVGTTAKLYVWSNTGNLVWSSAFDLPVGSANENYVTANFTIPAGVAQIKVGVLWSSPVVGNTFYINQVKLYKTDLEYQYFLTDQIGSPRVVLGTTPATQTFTATMESENVGSTPDKENQLWFLNHIVREVNLTANATPGGDEVVRLSSANHIGPARSMKVFPGDKVDANVMAYYGAASSLTQTTAGIMAAAVSTVLTGGIGGGVDGAISQAYSTTGNPAISLSPFQGTTKPSAFLNYILFDENYMVLEAKSAPLGSTAGVLHQVPLPQVSVREPGYLFVYLSYDNESTAPVYFDELKIIYQESPIVQVNNYYPYGHVSTEWVRDGEIDNNFLFQGKELNDQTGLQDFGSRQYAGDVGRWFAEDPAGQYGSPYLAMGNNPVMYADPDGEFAYLAGMAVSAVVGGIVNWGIEKIEGDINSSADGWKAFGIGAAHGALLFATAGTGNAEITLGRVAVRSAINAASNQLPSIPLGSNASISPSVAFGTSGMSVGANASLSGAAKYFSGGINYGFGYTFSDQVTGKTGFNHMLGGGFLAGGPNFRGGLSTNQFWGRGFNQRTGTINFSGKGWNFAYENDWQLGLPIGGGTDKFRTAALRAEYNDFSAGFNLFTGDPDGVDPNTQEKYRPHENGTYVARDGSSPDKYRLGALYVGYGSYRAGYSSEKYRHKIQNEFAHDFLQKGNIKENGPKHFAILGGYEGFYLNSMTRNPYTTW